MYRIECRYEYWSSQGLIWTNWFIMSLAGLFNDKEKATKEIEKLKKLDKGKKNKHEYRLMEE